MIRKHFLNATSKIRTFLKLLKRFGLKFACKYTLDFLGIKTYLMVKYPVTGIKVKVRFHPFWERLEGERWELNCIKHVSKITREGQIILDIGAWIGPYTLLFSKLVQDTGQVYAFEPDPKALALLRENLEKNNLTNVRVEGICISNYIGKAKLKSYSQFGDSGSSLILPNGQTVAAETTVKTTTIDRYCEENGVCPDGIKIDVEGAEGLVIEECQNTIMKCSPWILLEFHGHHMPKKEREVCWRQIVSCAKEVIFIDGSSNYYHYGDKVESVPDCLYFHVFIKPKH